ncbi:eukaryotic translation initiation factor 3 subunit M [Gaeumannomyces tritici R3-111a-1]|uniref:Eukaryotic translation initiation factor 3 subunit M n=1 Tax=Gaeumannomyces tritici (strain R3-111a-1) TaxID=644352 RepID=J3NJZ8_GAET3|nr:eukaryotic translation initiation factor 3 subunit M [Gaeumannomyces tritici R3-111a-1]EJT81602.1 eukaryotic translation initiation factor 3 subunit M [Gaeumannomyces tritici R3-111a-1]
MAATQQPQLVFVDGAFAELAQDMANLLSIGDEVKPLLEKEQEEEALASIVKASTSLNSIPEKEFTGAYNALVYLVLQSKEPKKHLPTVCQNLTKPVTSSPQHGAQLALFELTSIFNLLKPADPVRFHVLIQVVRFYKIHNLPISEHLKGALKNLPRWLETWESSEEDCRKIYLEVVDIMTAANEEEEAYQHLLKALRTYDADEDEESSSEEAQQFALRAVRMAISSPTRLSYEDLRPLQPVEALRESHPVHFQLLEIFCERDLDDYDDFREEHEGFIEKEKLDHDVLCRKMRLLTFASLAASNMQTREISYKDITKALQIPSEDVEMWAIDVIRAGLVEGKLSQKKNVFLIHSVKYRIFGEKQWRQLLSTLEKTKKTVGGLLATLRKEEANAQQEAERKLVETSGQQGGGGDRQRRGGRGQQQSQRERNDRDD